MDAYREVRKNYQWPMALTPVAEQFFGQFPQQVNNHHIMTTLPIEMPNSTVKYLDQLKGHCLMEIFSQNSLSFMDLSSLAETCKLFKEIAQQVFPKKLNFCPLKSYYSITAKGYRRQVATAQGVERMLNQFGPCLVAVSLYGQEVFDLIHLLAKHCVGTLKELEIGCLKITAVLAAALKPVLRQLQTLCIRDSIFECGANGFANCDSLIELTIVGEHRWNAILQNNFPALQRFTFEEQRNVNGSDLNELINFLDRHKTLKYLHLPAHNFHTIDVFVRKLGNSCKELKELHIGPPLGQIYWALMLDFSNFQSLNRLRLDCGVCLFKGSTSVQLQNVKSLEMLSIRGAFNRKKLFEVLPLLKNLRELNISLDSYEEKVQWTSLPQLKNLRLSIHHRHDIDNVVDIIRKLANLEELEINGNNSNFVLSEREFYEIVNVVKGRPNVLTLKCTFEFNQSSETFKKIYDENLKVKLIKWKH